MASHVIHLELRAPGPPSRRLLVVEDGRVVTERRKRRVDPCFRGWLVAIDTALAALPAAADQDATEGDHDEEKTERGQ